MRLLKSLPFLLFLVTFIFLNLFTGAYWYLLPFFADPAVEYFFYGENPTFFKSLISSFGNLKEMLFFLILSGLFAFWASSFLRSTSLKNGKIYVIVHSLTLTVLLGGLYSTYRALLALKADKSYLPFYFSEVKKEIILLILCYFIISIPFAYLFSRKYYRGKN
ncbi:hypothetical protein V9K67_20660 [Paraflavisolibacter sp. H34]|uniref:hypothetical protein n=1 Tax=Huijunlia imazamoxiresistens TaxID=3127457 RepID=UPI003016F255